MGPTVYTLLSGDLIFQMLRFQELMGSARPGTSFCGHYIISTHVFNCFRFGDERSGWHLCFLDRHQRQLPRAPKGHERRHSFKRGACRSSADECVVLPARTHEGYHQPTCLQILHAIRTSTASTAVLSKVSIEGRQINRGEYTCSSSSNGNVAGSSLGGVAVLADMF